MHMPYRYTNILRFRRESLCLGDIEAWRCVVVVVVQQSDYVQCHKTVHLMIAKMVKFMLYVSYDSNRFFF